MLSLKDFKAAKIEDSSSLLSIKGGIACSQIIEVIDILNNSDDPNDREQAKVVAAMAANGQIQCT